jgi:hypothetical protein
MTCKKRACHVNAGSELTCFRFTCSLDLVANVLGRYRQKTETDEGIYLSAWTVVEDIYDQVNLDEPGIVRRPCMSLGWLTQPDKLNLMPTNKGLGDEVYGGAQWRSRRRSVQRHFSVPVYLPQGSLPSEKTEGR